MSHEPAVGFAADAAARYGSRLGVAVVTYGAGALNMINPIATAYAEKSPLVVISGAPGAAEGTMGLGLHHQVKHLDSQRLIMNQVTVAQCVLDDPQTAPVEIARVLSATLEHSRPVYIEFPRDMVGANVESVPAFRSRVGMTREAARACAEEVISLLEAAERPALLLGVEVRRFDLEAKVAELASKLAIPVATSFMGRGILAETDAPVVGTYLGLAGEPDVRRTVEHSDALLMFGVILCDTNFGVSRRQIDMRRAIHAFDGEVGIGHHTYTDVTLPDLIDALLDGAGRLGAGGPGRREDYPTGLEEDDEVITPGDIAKAVNDVFAEHGPMPLSSDMGDCLFTAMDMIHTPLVAPGYYATMGPASRLGLGCRQRQGRGR